MRAGYFPQKHIFKPPRGSATLDMTNPITGGMVACWLMHEGARNLNLKDYSGYGNDAVMTNNATMWTEITSGRYGRSLYFGGATQGTVAAPRNIPLPNAPISVSVRFMFTATPGGNQGLITLDNAATATTQVAMYYRTTGPVFEVDSAGGATLVRAPYFPTIREWHDMVYVGNRNGVNTHELYLDGVLVASASATSNTLAFTELVLGCGFGPATDDFVGAMERAIIWNRGLHAAEVKELWTNPFGFLI